MIRPFCPRDDAHPLDRRTFVRYKTFGEFTQLVWDWLAWCQVCGRKYAQRQLYFHEDR